MKKSIEALQTITPLDEQYIRTDLSDLLGIEDSLEGHLAGDASKTDATKETIERHLKRVRNEIREIKWGNVSSRSIFIKEVMNRS